LLQVRGRAVPRIAGLIALVAAAAVPAAPALAASPKQKLGSRVLREGMSGSDVATLQSDLTKAGLSTPAVGTFGPITERNVKSFESKYHLAVNGIVNSAFVKELQLVLASGAGDTSAAAGSGGTPLGGANPKTKVNKNTQNGTTADPTSAVSSDNPVLATVVQNGTSAHLGNRTLRPGMRGHDVRVLQGYLTLAGYPTDVDGDYGPGTQANVEKWEQANGLTANGVITYAQSLDLRQDVAKAMTSSGPVSKATLNSNGTVTAPADAPQAVQEVIAAANSIIDQPYVYGGGHQAWKSNGYDCSGAVSFALHGANLLNSPEDSTELESYGSAGPGKWITIYADAEHTFIVVAGLAFDTAHYGPTTPGGTGPRWLTPANATANLSDGGNYIVRHPSGL
jgi:peptidoglycan hydrolase-like protein with peptidoglycan-binding domain